MTFKEYEENMMVLIRKAGLAYVDAERGYITREKCNEFVNNIIVSNAMKLEPEWTKEAIFEKIMNEVNVWKKVLAAV